MVNAAHVFAHAGFIGDFDPSTRPSQNFSLVPHLGGIRVGVRVVRETALGFVKFRTSDFSSVL